MSQNPPAAGVLVYGEDGEYAGTLGAAGEGPGEFERPWRITSTPTGEILVHDLTSATHVFAVDGTYRRTIADMPMPAASAATVGDSLIAVHNSRARPPRAPDREVNLYSVGTGDWVRGLGPSGELRPGTPRAVDLIGHSSARDGVWLAVAEDGRLEKWSSSGTLAREVDWGAVAADAGVEGIGPAALWEDSTGSELWIMAAVPVGDGPASVEPGQPLPWIISILRRSAGGSTAWSRYSTRARGRFWLSGAGIP